MKTVLVLGANSDIAVATTRKFAQNRYDLILCGRSLDQLEIIKQDISIKSKVNVKTVAFDALDFASHLNFYSSLKVVPDITICAFGYLGDQEMGQNFWEESEKILGTNYTGAVSILNVIANDYEKRRQGCIVGISSVAGDRGRQSNYLYGSAKSGFTTYLAGLRNRLYRSDVQVITVKPGFVATKMTAGLNLPKPLTAQPEDLADAIYNSVHKKKDEIYILWLWRWIMLIIKLIPETIFKKLKL